jgi:cellulose biosynthesis protein BcsQ
MQILVIDVSPVLRATLLGRVQEAARQAGLQRIPVLEVDANNLDSVNWELTVGCFIGSGCGALLKELMERFEGPQRDCPFAFVLDADTYSAEAVAIHKLLHREVIPDTDLIQMANFIVDCEQKASGRASGIRSRHIIGVTQLKGGVGGTSLTAALGVCWARQGKTVALLDLDDVSPQLTEWAKVPEYQRTLTGELLKTGEVTIDKLRDFVYPVEGFDGRLVAIGQPVQYAEAFHFRAYVLDGAPSASEFISRVLSLLSNEYDVVLVDIGRSWGVSTFAALPWCEHVVFVVDDDGLSVRRSLDALARLKQESGDPEEFNMSRWVVALNKVTGGRLSNTDLSQAIANLELFPRQSSLFQIPYTDRGRLWGVDGDTLYDRSEQGVRRAIEALAHHLVPCEGLQSRLAKSGGLLSRVSALFG